MFEGFGEGAQFTLDNDLSWLDFNSDAFWDFEFLLWNDVFHSLSQKIDLLLIFNLSFYYLFLFRFMFRFINVDIGFWNCKIVLKIE